VYLAMLARGYQGAMPRLSALVLRRVDVLFVAGLAAWLLAVRVVAAG
jgi:energy-coupling factor transporter transmembrane protein EcfT